MENIRYLNYKCKKCGQLISIEILEKYLKYGVIRKMFTIWPYDQGKHNCITEEGEIAFLDLISVSENPIKNAIVRKFNDQNEFQ